MHWGLLHGVIDYNIQLITPHCWLVFGQLVFILVNQYYIMARHAKSFHYLCNEIVGTN